MLSHSGKLRSPWELTAYQQFLRLVVLNNNQFSIARNIWLTQAQNHHEHLPDIDLMVRCMQISDCCWIRTFVPLLCCHVSRSLVSVITVTHPDSKIMSWSAYIRKIAITCEVAARDDPFFANGRESPFVLDTITAHTLLETYDLWRYRVDYKSVDSYRILG